MDERLAFDIFSAILLLAVAVLGSWLPLHLSKRDAAASGGKGGGHQSSSGNTGSKVAYHLGNCLSAGVMLSAGYCHLLADALHNLSFVGRFPMATFLAAVGFLVTLASDQVVHSISHAPGAASGDGASPAPACRSRHRDTQDGSGGGGGGDDDDDDDEERPQQAHGAHAASSTSHHRHPHHHHSSSGGGGGGAAVELSAAGGPHGGKRQRYSENTPLLSFQQQDHGTAPRVGAAAVVAAAVGVAAAAPSHMSDVSGGGASPADRSHHHHALPVSTLAGTHSGELLLSNGHAHHHAPTQQQQRHGHSHGGGRHGGGSVDGGGGSQQGLLEPEVSGHFDVLLAPGVQRLHFATAVLLAAALCVHSVLEGMALGAQQTMRATQDIMVAIAAHKGLAAYALGSSVVESGADLRRFWTVTLTFSLATPVAIFLGYGLSAVSNGAGSSALSALASGTFLYVAVMEVIPRELTGPHTHHAPLWLRGAKVGMLMLGFGLMSLLAIWA